MAAGQERVPHTLPIAASFPDTRVEGRSGWRAGYGAAPWLVLRRLLLDVDGAAVRRRRDEFDLGRRHCGVRARRKARAAGPSCWAGRWTSVHGVGGVCPAGGLVKDASGEAHR